MALKNYSLLKGRAVDLAFDDDQTPHVDVHIKAAGMDYRMAVNVRSMNPPHPLLYRLQSPFTHPMTPKLQALPEGLHRLDGVRDDLRLDYVRGGFVQRRQMTPVPYRRQGPRNDLREYIAEIITLAINDRSMDLYAFGEAWDPEPNRRDPRFRFRPARGIHDIHMNQGSSGRFRYSNGPDQDGALLLHHRRSKKWHALFLAFQDQSWTTDPETGHPTRIRQRQSDEAQAVSGALQIIAAMINPIGSEQGKESVTLINRSDQDAPMHHYALLDDDDRLLPLSGTLKAGQCRTYSLPAKSDSPQLRNKGGRIRLVDDDLTVVDMVSYSRKDILPEGWTTLFPP